MLIPTEIFAVSVLSLYCSRKNIKKMNTYENKVDYVDNVITISDDVIEIDSSSSISDGSVTENINISDRNISECDSIITVSDASFTDVGNASERDNIIIVSDASIITVSDATEITTPSFKFDTSTKLLLQQPRTSTPVVRRSAVEFVIDLQNGKYSSIFLCL